MSLVAGPRGAAALRKQQSTARVQCSSSAVPLARRARSMSQALRQASHYGLGSSLAPARCVSAAPGRRSVCGERMRGR